MKSNRNILMKMNTLHPILLDIQFSTRWFNAYLVKTPTPISSYWHSIPIYIQFFVFNQLHEYVIICVKMMLIFRSEMEHHNYEFKMCYNFFFCLVHLQLGIPFLWFASLKWNSNELDFVSQRKLKLRRIKKKDK